MAMPITTARITVLESFPVGLVLGESLVLVVGDVLVIVITSVVAHSIINDPHFMQLFVHITTWQLASSCLQLEEFDVQPELLYMQKFSSKLQAPPHSKHVLFESLLVQSVNFINVLHNGCR